MKILEPSYYKSFKCIADKCKDTCCIGWRVPIDKASYQKYEKIQDEFGNSLNSNITRIADSENDEMYGEFVLDKNMKCPLLNEDKLCELYINKGVDYLCNTCTIYPRSVILYGGVAERNLALSCPSVAQILIEKTEKIDFIMNDETKHNENEFIINFNEKYKEFYDLIWEGRSLSIDVAQFNEIPMWQRLIIIKVIGDRIQGKVNNKEVCDVYEFARNLKNELISESMINSLNNLIKPGEDTKADLILMIFEILKKHGIGNIKFAEMAYDAMKMLNDGKKADERLSNKEEQFNIYFKNREYILENYIVYNLYTTYMKCVIDEKLDIDIEIFILIISYSMIKLFLAVIWDKNNHKLTDDEIVDVLYSFSREMEHSEVSIKAVYDEMNKNGFNTIGYLTTMIY